MTLKIIKAFPVDAGFDFAVLKTFEKYVDYFLFDAKGESRGGTGRTFDWKLLDSYVLDVPFFLSGGISIENISRANAMKNLKLYAFDLNSRFELEPGVKDVNLIRELKKLLTTA